MTNLFLLIKTPEELKKVLRRGAKPKNSSLKVSSNIHKSNSVSALPSSVDWRTKLNLTIRDQAGCGSCWTFSAVYEIESFNILKNGKTSDLSEQNLVDCVYSSDGCEGGWMEDAYNYIIKNNGINTEAAYPYKSGSTQTVSFKL